MSHSSHPSDPSKGITFQGSDPLLSRSLGVFANDFSIISHEFGHVFHDITNIKDLKSYTNAEITSLKSSSEKTAQEFERRTYQ